MPPITGSQNPLTRSGKASRGSSRSKAGDGGLAAMSLSCMAFAP